MSRETSILRGMGLGPGASGKHTPFLQSRDLFDKRFERKDFLMGHGGHGEHHVDHEWQGRAAARERLLLGMEVAELKLDSVFNDPYLQTMCRLLSPASSGALCSGPAADSYSDTVSRLKPLFASVVESSGNNDPASILPRLKTIFSILLLSVMKSSKDIEGGIYKLLTTPAATMTTLKALFNFIPNPEVFESVQVVLSQPMAIKNLKDVFNLHVQKLKKTKKKVAALTTADSDSDSDSGTPTPDPSGHGWACTRVTPPPPTPDPSGNGWVCKRVAKPKKTPHNTNGCGRVQCHDGSMAAAGTRCPVPVFGYGKMQCADGSWVDSGVRCPAAAHGGDDGHGKMQCPDGSWVDSGVRCPAAAHGGDDGHGKIQCVDGSWVHSGTQCVAYAPAPAPAPAPVKRPVIGGNPHTWAPPPSGHFQFVAPGPSSSSPFPKPRKIKQPVKVSSVSVTNATELSINTVKLTSKDGGRLWNAVPIGSRVVHVLNASSALLDTPSMTLYIDATVQGQQGQGADSSNDASLFSGSLYLFEVADIAKAQSTQNTTIPIKAKYTRGLQASAYLKYDPQSSAQYGEAVFTVEIVVLRAEA